MKNIVKELALEVLNEQEIHPGLKMALAAYEEDQEDFARYMVKIVRLIPGATEATLKQCDLVYMIIGLPTSTIGIYLTNVYFKILMGLENILEKIKIYFMKFV